ncbi:hypothetical protein [Chroococcus sp. FPU101]|uniref:hypothetical protein n=1 Tax=Chroococcus sp. FPU101 TaxID=1974212 RepID=UPI001A8D6061|nr:hypothetical protein [Chroococcus sp. FPU101]GFE72323.1 hypothetical protein CFPU101_49330 [Chroococcus sp. FPU101]
MDTNKYKTYACQYRYGNSYYAFHIQATSPGEAKERITALKTNGEVLGESGGLIPVYLENQNDLN